MEAMNKNLIFLNVSATLMGNLAVYPSASKHIVKRNGCAVIIECIKHNLENHGVLAKLLRCISNLVLTENKAFAAFAELDAEHIVDKIKNKITDHRQIQKSSHSFLKAMKLKSHKLQQAKANSQSLRDKVDIKFVKFLTSGTMMKKYCSSAKPRKRLISLSDDLEHMILTDPNGKKAPKQLNVRHITELRTGACTFTLRRSGLGWKSAKDDKCFALFTMDPSGKTNDLNLECKTVESFKKWTDGLATVIKCAQEKSKVKPAN